jgi:hypothetical protein
VGAGEHTQTQEVAVCFVSPEHGVLLQESQPLDAEGELQQFALSGYALLHL